uniref:Uncharacterized protein n=1 Tax=Photinus pyralis TaxID=7054 RepID=A0A1Y1N8I2_PHOPY
MTVPYSATLAWTGLTKARGEKSRVIQQMSPRPKANVLRDRAIVGWGLIANAQLVRSYRDNGNQIRTRIKKRRVKAVRSEVPLILKPASSPKGWYGYQLKDGVEK